MATNPVKIRLSASLSGSSTILYDKARTRNPSSAYRSAVSNKSFFSDTVKSWTSSIVCTWVHLSRITSGAPLTVMYVLLSFEYVENMYLSSGVKGFPPIRR